MSVLWSNEQRQFQQSVRSVANERIKPLVYEIDRDESWSWEIVDALGELGMFGLFIPEEYGGSGADVTSLSIALEELGRVFPSAAATVRATFSASNCILDSDDEELKGRYLKKMAMDHRLGAICISEPDAGSDTAAIQTRADRRQDSYVINGTKSWITNGGVADIYVVVAREHDTEGGYSASTFVVDADTPGLTFGNPEEKMCLRGSRTSQVFLDDVEIPARQRLGAEGEGRKIALRNLATMRLTSGAVTVGIASAALEYAVNYSKERVQFGRPISDFQGLRFKMADMAIKIDAARALLYQTAARADAGEQDLRQEAAVVKCFASDVAMEVTTDAVQILGGVGILKSSPVEMLMRDAKGFQIFTGTNEIQRIIIARGLLGRESAIEL